MVDIFISYAREDETRIRELVHGLEEHHWSIFWDRDIPAGKTWQSYIGQALTEAKCVIVAWSQHSITSDWVIEEANDAKDRGILVPVFLESVKPPLGFRGIQAADLTEWVLAQFSPQFEKLIADITAILVSSATTSMTTVAENRANHEREQIARLRTQMLNAHSSWELRNTVYELDKHLAKYPHSPEARLLKDQMVAAMKRAEQYERREEKAVSAPRASHFGWAFYAIIAAALTMVLGFLIYLALSKLL